MYQVQSQENAFTLPVPVVPNQSVGITGSVEDSRASSGVEYKGSSGCNSGSGKNGRRRLIFQRQTQDNNSNDDNMKEVPKLNVNRIKISESKKSDLVSKSTPRIIGNNYPQKNKQEILVLAQHVSRSNDSSSQENTYRAKYPGGPYQGQYHNKETLQKIINYQKSKKMN